MDNLRTLNQSVEFLPLFLHFSGVERCYVEGKAASCEDAPSTVVFLEQHLVLMAVPVGSTTPLTSQSVTLQADGAILKSTYSSPINNVRSPINVDRSHVFCWQ